jgi:CRISPR-associated protein (TIGR03986 family)
MNPKHIEKITDKQRRAIAPYNFVELPEQIVPAQQPLPEGDRYYTHLHTGRIDCTLTTESPLYIRCGLTPEQFKEAKEAKDLPEFFYLDPETKKPVLPGSSLRGMLRILVEIASFSKIEQVSDAQKFFFRAVAANNVDDPLKNQYSNALGNQGKNVKAGYLCQQGRNWFIRSALSIDNSQSFVWIKEKVAKSAINELVVMENIKEYRPQYIQNISFEDIITKNGRKFAQKISRNSQKYQYIGVLVTAGNMLEGAPEGTKCNRTNHCLIQEPNAQAELIPISNDAIRDYLNALTPFQKDQPFNQEMGVLKNNRVIFYIQPKNGQEVTLFGQSPNFRIPYIPQRKTKAASAIDFIPDHLKDTKTIDLADAIFGWVRREKQEDRKNQSRAGRVFVGDAICQQSASDDIWLTGNQDTSLTPQILASPKPTTFQHYLVQTDVEKKNLKHYASNPNKETVIRGHKLYWHKGSNPDIKHSDLTNVSDSQTTQIKPIKAGVSFKFTINFENLTDVELGALLWVLDKATGDYRLKLGMGKPLGMGAVQIQYDLYLSDRTKRYNQLFNNDNWEVAETIEQDLPYQQCFENHILEKLLQIGRFEDITRIKMLLAMLKWDKKPSSEYLEVRRYMEIERKQEPRIGDDPNEYKHRPILPTPLDVAKPQASPEFLEEQEIDAIVMDIQEQQVQKGKKTQLRTTIVYKIEGSDSQAIEEVNKQKVLLYKGDIVKVRIVKIQGNSIRKVKRVDSN